MNAYINMSPADRRKSVYRVFSYERLVQLFESNQNVLVRPKLWDDPLENYVLDAAHRRLADRSGESHPRARAILAVKERLYGQCWTLTRESDAMWRIYSPDRTGVRVRSRIPRLLKMLRRSDEAAGADCFIGAVEYLRGRSLFSRLSDPKWLASETRDAYSQAKSLFVKRDAFQHENEVRIVALNEENDDQDLFRYSVDPHALIDEVMFDPRMSEELVTVFSEDLRNRLGFSGKISQSKLYQVPTLEDWRKSR